MILSVSSWNGSVGIRELFRMQDLGLYPCSVTVSIKWSLGISNETFKYLMLSVST